MDTRTNSQPGAPRVFAPKALTAAMPFAEFAGVVLDTATPDRVCGHVDWTLPRCTAGGVLHGGVLMTLADSVGAACAYLGLPPGCGTATTSSTTHLLRAVAEGSVTATARPLHRGRSQVVVGTELHDVEGRLVAHTVQVQAVLTG